jgi:putative tricarboxylic transport membrane protein
MPVVQSPAPDQAGPGALQWHRAGHERSTRRTGDYFCDQVVSVVQQVQAGTIKGFAVGTPERNPALPNVPTAKEGKLPEFDVLAWNAVFAPKGTPKPVLDKLAQALDLALDDDGVRKRLLDLGAEIPKKSDRGQQPLAALVKSEIARWTSIINAANK